MDFLSLLGELFIPRPWLALVPALVFAGLYLVSSRRLAGVTAGAWLLYAALEFGNYMRWTCSGECNIRVDLLLIYPALALLSIAAIAAAGATMMRAAAR